MLNLSEVNYADIDIVTNIPSPGAMPGVTKS